jgi:hypothetical protein
MVDRAARKAHSREELMALLMADIESPQDREKFRASLSL